MAANVTLALVAGGGTGGHVCIGVAIAQAIRDLAPRHRIVLVGCRMDTDAPMMKQSRFPFYIVPACPWPGGFSWRRFPIYAWDAAVALASGLSALVRALVVLAQERPKVVIGTGGYGSAPAVVAAWLRGVPVLIHEPDSVIGLANRFLARFARTITLGYGDVAAALPDGRTRATGNPVRRDFRTVRRAEARRSLGIKPGQRLVVAFGGSQGSRTINQAVSRAAEALLRDGETHLLHVSGGRDYAMLQEAVKKMGEPVRERYRLYPHLDEREMATALAAGDAVVMRGGASAIAEAAATGIPAVVVPYPFARAQHQMSNARFLLDRKQGMVIEDKMLTPDVLSAAIERISREAVRRIDRRRRDSAGRVAGEALALAGVDLR